MIWTKINILRMWTYESTLISSRRICSPAAPRFWQWYFSSLCAWNQRNNPANPYDRLSRTIRWYRLLNGYDKLRNAPKRLFRPKTQISGNEIFRQALQESPVHHLRDAASFRRAEIFAVFSLAQKLDREYNVPKIFIFFLGWTAAFAAGRPYFVLFYRTGESLVGSLRARQIAKPTVTKQVIGRRMKCQTFVTSLNPTPAQSAGNQTGVPYSMSRET